ncbi:MAG: 7-cyano-7-deazaguanine synthase QueC [Deltaproteobacteria bacterium]|nr:7-cyano-7-deazaguanine synthase QueC [Deltaproteobacteria bacterium]
MSDKKAIVLLSGGLDSTTCLAIAKSQGFKPHCLSFQYGQLHSGEIDASRKVASHFGVEEHTILQLPSNAFKSALTGQGKVPKYDQSPSGEGIPVTYVPARNTIFLSYALALAEVTEIEDIFIGVSSVDYSGYPDCRPEFIDAFEKLANAATKIGTTTGHINIIAPLINLTKAETIKLGISLGVDYSMTHTCYDPDENLRACGHCDSCLLRKKGFEEAGIADPTVYVQDTK